RTAEKISPIHPDMANNQNPTREPIQAYSQHMSDHISGALTSAMLRNHELDHQILTSPAHTTASMRLPHSIPALYLGRIKHQRLVSEMNALDKRLVEIQANAPRK